MEKHNLRDFKNWFIGDFDPSLQKTPAFEAGIKNYVAGQKEASHFHRLATEYTVILKGKVLLNGVPYVENDIITIHPHEITSFESITDSSTLVIKTPSMSTDKFLNKLHVVVPIGVGAPGTPIPRYLEQSLDSLLEQSYKDIYITVAADRNIPDEAKSILEARPVHVEWFEPHSYFSKSGIWGKIFTCWEKIPSEYVAFLHYDDVWDVEKAEKQIAFIESNALDGAWSQTHILNQNDEKVTGDQCPLTEFTPGTMHSISSAFCHSVLVRRKNMLECGILDHRNQWSAIFERLMFVYLHKIRMKKCPDAIFYYRSHDQNISSTVREDVPFVQEQRGATSYSLDETMKDAGEIGLDKIMESIQNNFPQ